MRVLFFGDVFGSIGRRILAEQCKRLKLELNIDVCIANGENAAGGKGITRNFARKFHKYGVHIITGGNHSMSRPDVFTGKNPVANLLRPLNIFNEARGQGSLIYELPDKRLLGVINLQGRTFFNDETLDCPFKRGRAAVQELSAKTNTIIIDFHAEATSEKICLAHYLDGTVSALLGTHTHVQTADERILSGGTAFITDAGMTGPEDSAIGMSFESVLPKYLEEQPFRFEPASKGPVLSAVVVDIDDHTGKALEISRILRRIQFTGSSVDDDEP